MLNIYNKKITLLLKDTIEIFSFEEKVIEEDPIIKGCTYLSWDQLETFYKQKYDKLSNAFCLKGKKGNREFIIYDEYDHTPIKIIKENFTSDCELNIVKRTLSTPSIMSINEIFNYPDSNIAFEYLKQKGIIH